MNWSDKQVFVSGAGGFIGSHLTARLITAGAKVRAFTHYNSRGDPGLLRQLPVELRRQLEIVSGDLRDPQAVQQAIRGSQVVFHLGAIVSIPYSYLHPCEVAETNFMGTLNVLLASRDEGVERVVHTSTSEVYGTAQRVPIDESHPLRAQSPYAASKTGADQLAGSFYCTYGLPVIVVRPFNTYGPRQSARAVIPAIITQALTQEAIHLGNLETTRDFTFVNDTVNGFLKAAGCPNAAGQVIQLGTGRDIKIGELAHLILKKVNHASRIEVETARLRPQASEVYRLISDNSLAQKILGWKPEIDLEQGLDITIHWIRDHLELYRSGVYEF